MTGSSEEIDFANSVFEHTISEAITQGFLNRTDVNDFHLRDPRDHRRQAVSMICQALDRAFDAPEFLPGSNFWAEVLGDQLDEAGVFLEDEEENIYDVSFCSGSPDALVTVTHTVRVTTRLNESENNAILELAASYLPVEVLGEVTHTDIQPVFRPLDEIL